MADLCNLNSLPGPLSSSQWIQEDGIHQIGVYKKTHWNMGENKKTS